MTVTEPVKPNPALSPPLSWWELAAYALLILLCVSGVGFLLALPAESLITDLVYRAF